MQMPRKTFKVAQHLKAGWTQSTRPYRVDCCFNTARVPDDVACIDHHLGKPSACHGIQFGFERSRQGDRVHAKSFKQLHRIGL